MRDSFQWDPVRPWEGAVWRGWGGQASGVRKGQNRRLLQAETQCKQMKRKMEKNEATHSPVVCGGWGCHHHRYACATQCARSSGGTSEAHLAASSNKAWQGLAGVGRQLREEGDERHHSFQEPALRLCVHRVITYRRPTCRGGLKALKIRIIIIIIAIIVTATALEGQKKREIVGCFCYGSRWSPGSVCAHWSCLQMETAVAAPCKQVAALFCFPLAEHLYSAYK